MKIDPYKHEETWIKWKAKNKGKIQGISKDNPKITQEELSKQTGLTRRGIEWNILKLKEKGILKRVGPDRGGYWEIEK